VGFKVLIYVTGSPKCMVIMDRRSRPQDPTKLWLNNNLASQNF
jgi:hypothetical protein